MDPFRSETISEIKSSDNNQLSSYQQLMNRLEQFKNLSISTTESKKQVWLKFLSVWGEVLSISASDSPSCYAECGSLLEIMIKSIDFYTIRKDDHIARETFFWCINQLNQTHIKNYLLLTKDEQESEENKLYYKHVSYILLFVVQAESFFTFDSIQDQQHIEEYCELLTLFIDRIDKRMPEHASTVIEKDYKIGDINEVILTVIWSLSDRTVLIPMLLKCDLAKRAIGWLAQASMLAEKSRRSLISIIHNIARHDDGADELNKYDAVIIIKRYQNSKIETSDSRILVITMALALVSTPEQLKRDKKGMNSVFNQLLQLIMDASKTDRYRSDGLHVSEPLCILVKMFVVEERSLDYILYHAETEPPSDISSTIDLFVTIFIDFSHALKSTDRLEQFTLIAVLNILWSISFQYNYQQELIKNEKFLDKLKIFIENNDLENMIEQYKPRSMEGIHQATQGILHNLNLNDNEITGNNNISKHQNLSINALPVNTIKELNSKPWIMISYCHDNNEFCSEIYDLLSTCKDDFSIWIDRTHCQGAGDLWESIANGMEQSNVILCLLSEQYFQSKSCRQEFIYAVDSLKRTIVPVLIENFDPKGWLGIRMTGMKYIRFRDIDQLEKNKKTELLNTIRLSVSSSKMTIRQNAVPSSQHHSVPLVVNDVATSNSSSQPLLDDDTSNGNDVNSWFLSHRISPEIRKLFNFETREEMFDYAQLLIEDREKQMNIYAKIYSQRNHGNEMPPHEFLRFANALEKQLNDNTLSTTSSVLDSSKSTRSTTCTIS
ncbi:unnamed protein product [Adineta steineri]|uniref:TIR domain-containing protein n=2 Tax=Adineta steineri TaxID=433720 RepID=A0A818YSM1_9BILA|nr:unnamed protein product [Adineta steineri]CAF3755050.1 unnamed protein product [Adineta steineri]